jgi:hypothetical protein
VSSLGETCWVTATMVEAMSNIAGFGPAIVVDIGGSSDGGHVTAVTVKAAIEDHGTGVHVDAVVGRAG